MRVFPNLVLKTPKADLYLSTLQEGKKDEQTHTLCTCFPSCSQVSLRKAWSSNQYWIHESIYSFTKQLLSVYSVPRAVSGTEDTDE